MDILSASLEATSKTVTELAASAHLFTPTTPVNVAWLNQEEDQDRLRTVRRLDSAGLHPVPIIAARRVQSKKHLFDLTEKLHYAGAQGHFMVVGGDPSTAAGPFAQAFDFLSTEWIETYRINHITLPGFPEGNCATSYRPDLPGLLEKVKLLEARGCEVSITTQLAFDPDIIVRWVSALRAAGIDRLVRIGIPGPTKQDRLLRFSRAFGVSIRRLEDISTKTNNVIDCTGLLEVISTGLLKRDIGNVSLHLYPFGGAQAAGEWLANYRPALQHA